MKSKNEHFRQEIASLTKIMTCFVAISFAEQNKIDLRSFRCSVSRAAGSLNGTSADLLPEDNLSLYDLLHALMLPSGNDAAWAIAENLGDEMRKRKESVPINKSNSEGRKEPFEQSSVHVFIKQMNKQARLLSMMNSHFSNPHGLSDKKNTSTAFDVVHLTNHALQNKAFREIIEKPTHLASMTRKKGGETLVTWRNTNKLLGEPGFSGVKTGITVPAGACLTTVWTDPKNEREVGVCVLKCKNEEQRFTDAKKLTEWATNAWLQINF